MDIAITHLSSKGQIVVPTAMRKDIKAGDKLILIKQDGKIIVKKANALDEQFAVDLAFAEQVEKAWKDHDAGKFVTLSKDAFLEELDQW